VVNVDKGDLTLQICRTPGDVESAKDGVKAVLNGLGRNIVSKLGDVDLGRTVEIFLRNKKKEVVGGVVGNIFGGWLYVSLLWVDESLRNMGNGTRLLRMIESEATKLGCLNAHLDTYSFEAKPFYEKNGYTLFATLGDYPRGHSKHFLRKRLQ
jgi:GNAT superfamily N-acetyltransferase